MNNSYMVRLGTLENQYNRCIQIFLFRQPKQVHIIAEIH